MQSAALWVVRLGMLVSVAGIAVGLAATEWSPARALLKTLALSVPYAVALCLLALPTAHRWRRQGPALAIMAAIVGLSMFFVVAPSLLPGDLGWGAELGLWLFPPTQIVIAVAAGVARRGLAPPAREATPRGLIALITVGYAVVAVMMLMPVLGHPPRVGNENSALSEVRSLISAQHAYAASSAGEHFGSLVCLLEPWECLPGYPRSMRPILAESMAQQSRRGYRFELHGVPVDGEKHVFSAFAYTAVPLETGSFPGWRRTGVRAFCGDDSGRLCYTADGSLPELRDGRCSPSCIEIR